MNKHLINGVAAVAMVTMLAGCSVNPTDAYRALEAQGFTNIELGGYAFFGCGEDDTFKTTFKATGVNGKPVEGVLCGGMFKGTTVRITG